MNNLVITKIPFSGFYNSFHSDEIDYSIERELEYLEEENQTKSEFYNDLKKENYDYQTICKCYAKAYASDFMGLIKSELDTDIVSEFDDLESPKFYNYSTDRIFIKIEYSDLEKVKSYVMDNLKNKFINKVKELFTSGSGFISFYSNDLDEWGDFKEWDYNQYGTLFEVLFESFNYSEYDILENSLSNGLVDECIDEGITAYKNKLRVKS